MDDNRRVKPSRIGAARIAAVAVAAAIALTGCSSSEPDEKPAATAVTPKGFDVPAGVTLTKGGTALAVGSPATVVDELAGQPASAVTVTVTKVKRGSIDDFTFFSLDEATKKSAPYYVTVNVRNEGPAGLGGSALPIYANDDTNTNLPASDIVGEFKPCPRSSLPDTFLPGAAADLCLVYLVPEGRTLNTIILQTGETKDAITWKP